MSVASAPVSRAVCLYNRVICGSLLSSCGCSSRRVFSRRSVPLLAFLRRGLQVPALIVSPGWDGLGARAAMAKKTGAGCLFPVPLLAWLLLFLASADYSTVSPDFVVALTGLSKAGLAVRIRVELDGDSGLVLIWLLLVRLAALEKH